MSNCRECRAGECINCTLARLGVEPQEASSLVEAVRRQKAGIKARQARLERSTDILAMDWQVRNPQLFLEHAIAFLSYLPAQRLSGNDFFGNMRAVEGFARAITAIQLEAQSV